MHILEITAWIMASIIVVVIYLVKCKGEKDD